MLNRSWRLIAYSVGLVTITVALALLLGCTNSNQSVDIDQLIKQLEERGYTPGKVTSAPPTSMPTPDSFVTTIQKVREALASGPVQVGDPTSEGDALNKRSADRLYLQKGQELYLLTDKETSQELIFKKLTIGCPGCPEEARLLLNSNLRPDSSWSINQFDGDEAWSGYPLVSMGFNVQNSQTANPAEAAWWHGFEANWRGKTEWNIDTHGENGRDHRIFAMQCSRIEYNNCSWHINGGEFKFSTQAQYDEAKGSYLLRATDFGVEVSRLAIGAHFTEAINLGNGHYIGFGLADEENQVVKILGFTKDNIVDLAPGRSVTIGGPVYIRGAKGVVQSGAVYLPNSEYLVGNTVGSSDGVRMLGIDANNRIQIDPDQSGVRMKGFLTEDGGGIQHNTNPLNFRIEFGSDGNLYYFAPQSHIFSADRTRDGGDVFRFRFQETDIANFAQDPNTGETVLSVQVNDGTVKVMRRVLIGTPDSCGTGYRCLRVEN